ncbi:MAG: hypothetical protein JXA71_19955 [Chitinispirillaceae bacterium]|nr:hypothetical protein [Chitinispirillaceae bacterium]
MTAVVKKISALARHTLAVMTCLVCAARGAEAGTGQCAFINQFLSNTAFLPDYHLDADLKYFSFQKNDYFREHYYLQNSVTFGFSLFSFWKRVHWAGEFHFIHGMGQSPGSIVFDPMDIGYGLLDMVEYRHPAVTLQVGLAHNCAHQIDRQELKTVYYNNPVFAAGSVNFRQSDYRENLLQKECWTFFDRFSWHCRTGCYLREFFGLASPSKLNGINPFITDLHEELRFCFYDTRSWIFDLKSNGMIGYHTDVPGNPAGNGIGWEGYLTLEAMSRRSAIGAMLFATFGFDKLPLYPTMDGSGFVPRFSYDRMLQIGIEVFL